MLHNFLSWTLSILGWTTAMLFWLDFHQIQSNLYKWFRMHWLPVAAQHPPTSTHWWQSTTPPEVWDPLVSEDSWYYHREAQNHFPECSRSPLLAGRMTFLPPSGMLYPCQPSSNNWKLISFDTTWLHPKFSLDLVLRALPLSVCLSKMNRFMYSPIVSSFG